MPHEGNLIRFAAYRFLRGLGRSAESDNRRRDRQTRYASFGKVSNRTNCEWYCGAK
jgi:hypothetical protein